METPSCGICSAIPSPSRASVVYPDSLAEALAPNFAKLEDFSVGYGRTSIRRCPECGSLYLYYYCYEYIHTASEEEAELRRLDSRDEIREALLAHKPATGNEAMYQRALELYTGTGVVGLLDCELCPGLDLETAQSKLEAVRGDYRICARCLTVYLCRERYGPPDFPPDWAVLAGVDTTSAPEEAEFRRLRPREAREQLRKTKWKAPFEKNLTFLFKEMKARLKVGTLSEDLRSYALDALADEGIKLQ